MRLVMETLMNSSLYNPLSSAINELAVENILIGHRLISNGDEHGLIGEEIDAFSLSVMKVRRASGAARMVARDLLARLGFDRRPIPRASSRAPIWPPGVVGSLSHDSHVAVAAVALRKDFLTLGIDIEPAEMLPSDLVDIVVSKSERPELENDPYCGRLLFTAKEAVYKAIYPLQQTILEHHDVEIDFINHTGTVRNSLNVELSFSISGHLIVLAFIRA